MNNGSSDTLRLVLLPGRPISQNESSPCSQDNLLDGKWGNDRRPGCAPGGVVSDPIW